MNLLIVGQHSKTRVNIRPPSIDVITYGWCKKSMSAETLIRQTCEEKRLLFLAYQQAAADYKIKKITYDRLRNVWTESPDVIAKQDVDVAEAAYDGARTLMQQRAALRDYTKVRAPYDGIVTARFADPGALIQVATSSATTAKPRPCSPAWAASTAAFTATLAAWLMIGKPDLTMIINGALAGLVAITASCAYVSVGSSVIIGAIAGVGVVTIVGSLLWRRRRRKARL